jgi:hypothetical protein
MAYDINPANTATTLNTPDVGNLRKLWKDGALMAEEEEDFMQQFEGNRESSPIWVQSDLAKREGATMTFTTTSGYYGEGKYGDEAFEASTDFEKDDLSGFNLNVDFVRNASSRNSRADEIMGLKDELKNMVPIKLGAWLGRLKKDQIQGKCVLTLPDENRIYAGGRTLATLGSADTLSWDDVVTTGYAMKPLGGIPADISKAGRNEIRSQLFIPSEVQAMSLDLDPDYKTLTQGADVRGAQNAMFKGNWNMIRGHSIVPYNAINHAGKGAVGSFLAPEAYLGATMAAPADNTAILLTGGGADNGGTMNGAGFPRWFKYFAGYDYRFVDTGVIDVSASSIGAVSGTNYAIIYNTTGVNAGKWGFVEYTTGNDGNRITVTKLLGDNARLAVGGARATTVGSVVWSGTLNTEAFTQGALIIPANAKGVPFGHALVLGNGGIVRGYGSERAFRSVEKVDGDYTKRTYIRSIFGQALRKDRKGRVPSVMLLTTAISRPGINLPTVA